VAFPARIEEPDGPADPILPARRFVLGVLRHVGVVDEPFFSPDPLLPSAPSSTAWSGAEDPDVAREMGTWTSVRWRVAPVYRALLVPVGFRVELTYETADTAEVLCVRLVVQRGRERESVGESVARECGSCASTNQWTVRGYVPMSVDGWGFEVLGVGGNVITWSGWGDFDDAAKK